MQFLGTSFNLTLGTWRLRFVLALEEAEEAIPPQPIVMRSQHRVGRRYTKVGTN